MVLAMANFAICDSFIKLASQTLPIGQILMVMSFGALFMFLELLRRQRQPLFSRDVFHPVVVWRTVGEIVGSFGIVMSLSLIPLTTLSAILQALPLVITLWAAVFLREDVGWRRWVAVCIGFIGVLVVLRPGTDGFQVTSLFAVLAVLGLSLRDLATRAVPDHISTPFVASWARILVGALGGVFMQFSGGWVSMSWASTMLLAGSIATLIIAYLAITVSVRIGEVSAVAPFRYSRLVFALILGAVVFGETPDAAMWIGSAMIIASGLYAFWREQRRNTAPA